MNTVDRAINTGTQRLSNIVHITRETYIADGLPWGHTLGQEKDPGTIVGHFTQWTGALVCTWLLT